MELYSASFEPHYPCWIVVTSGSVTQDSDGEFRFSAGGVSFVTLQDDAKELSVPIFTDEHLATVFVESGDTDDVIVAIEDRQRLIDMLGEAEKSGAVAVVFDPPGAVGMARRVWAIEYAIDRLRQGLSLQ